ncbi:hypothetical protein BpHYR1_002188 [Brachionus plicatilis]|uniref:Uncharacterized protein n=1 Tax=Brachionus plicatilis TaxID=10195 RepID=A0A3M7QAF4_BRAPC|nr:hypothetical protein BpHYR1_002188 [Brachionus plicatilis]
MDSKRILYNKYVKENAGEFKKEPYYIPSGQVLTEIDVLKQLEEEENLKNQIFTPYNGKKIIFLIKI